MNELLQSGTIFLLKEKVDSKRKPIITLSVFIFEGVNYIYLTFLTQFFFVFLYYFIAYMFIKPNI